MPCAKICCDLIKSNWITTRQICHKKSGTKSHFWNRPQVICQNRMISTICMISIRNKNVTCKLIVLCFSQTVQHVSGYNHTVGSSEERGVSGVCLLRYRYDIFYISMIWWVFYGEFYGDLWWVPVMVDSKSVKWGGWGRGVQGMGEGGWERMETSLDFNLLRVELLWEKRKIYWLPCAKLR